MATPVKNKTRRGLAAQSERASERANGQKPETSPKRRRPQVPPRQIASPAVQRARWRSSKPGRFCSVTEDGLAANGDASRQHLLPLIYINPQREYEFGMETHPWPSGVIIQNGSDVMTRRRLHCVDAGGRAPGECQNVITAPPAGGGGGLGRQPRLLSLVSSLISSAAYLNERLSGACDCLRVCLATRGNCASTVAISTGENNWIGRARRCVFIQSVRARDARAPCFAVFCFVFLWFAIVFFFLKWGLDVKSRTLKS